MDAGRVAIALLLVAACSKSGSSPESAPATEPPPAQPAGPPPAQPAKAEPRLRAADVVLDGLKLGEPFTRSKEAPYATPCDDDAVDRPKTRRALVYAALPCHGVTFPEQTTVVVIIDWAEPDDFTRPIRAIAWLGGHYFDARGSFPLKVGESKARALAVLGEPVQSFEIPVRDRLLVWSFAGDVHAVIDGDLLAGFVVGPMPADPKAGDWEVVSEMYREATPRVGGAPAGAVSREDCEKILARADQLMGHTRPRDPAKYAHEVDECVAEATPAMVACALAATTMDELAACGEQ